MKLSGLQENFKHGLFVIGRIAGKNINLCWRKKRADEIFVIFVIERSFSADTAVILRQQS